jgi:hypothetical protein
VIGNLGMAHMGMSMHSLIESSNQIKSNVYREGVPTVPVARRIREAVGVVRLIENDRKSDLALFNPEGLPSQYT